MFSSFIVILVALAIGIVAFILYLNESKKKISFCSECGKELNESNTCLNCGYKNKNNKVLYISIMIITCIFVLVMSVDFAKNVLNIGFSNETDEKSNLRNIYLPQVRIDNDYINIRKYKDTDSELLGTVLKDEIYTIVSIDKESVYKWIEIVTKNGIHGYIASYQDEESYVEYLDIDEQYLNVYIFTFENCDYCNELYNYIMSLGDDTTSRVHIESLDILETPYYEEMANALAKNYDIELAGYPVTLVNGQLFVGASEEVKEEISRIIKLELGIQNGTSSNNSANTNSGKTNNNSNKNTNGNSGKTTTEIKCDESQKQKLTNEYQTTLKSRESDYQSNIADAQAKVDFAKQGIDSTGGYLSKEEYESLYANASEFERKMLKSRYGMSTNYDKMVSTLNSIKTKYKEWKETYEKWYQEELKKIGC